MITYIESHENPIHVSPGTEPKLHNILTQEIMTDDIREDILNASQKGQELYDNFRHERYVEKSKRLSETIHRTNIKTFKSIHAEKKLSEKKKDQKRETAQAQKTVDLARVRGYDMKHLFQYDLVESSPLFDDNGFMTDPRKSTLCNELEKNLKKEDYIHPSVWPACHTTYLIDVMACMRRVRVKSLKSFGDFISKGFFDIIQNICRRASRIDFVFDTYLDGSIKDSERKRRSSNKPIEINSVTEETPLPIDMDTFWPSSGNKIKLQLLLRKWLLANGFEKFPHIKIILSGTGVRESDRNPCECVTGANESAIVSELQFDIEEADVRLMPHAVHAVQDMTRCIVIISNDTDVVVLGIHNVRMLHQQGLNELWLRGGVGDSTRYIPLHTLASDLGSDVCKVLPALHILSGSDTTSKVGTKSAALKANPALYLKQFGKNIRNIERELRKGEEFLVKVLMKGGPFSTMDELRYYKYHNSKNITFADLPPTSFAIRGHILHAFYATYMQLHYLDNPDLDPTEFGFEEEDEILVPNMCKRLVPDDLPQSCTCTKCSTKRCLCRHQGVPCCIYCKCQGFEVDGASCKNPLLS